MAKATSLPLYELKFRNNIIPRTIELIILFLLLSLIVYRILTLRDNGYPWLVALLCESWFTFNWILNVSNKWNQVETKTYPERLLKRKSEFPPVDMFVTTADPELEPPIITMNTVLSLLAVDYPANKLACYLSDDAASPLTFYSLVETSKFAKLWVPFCKKYNISLRAPFRYFKAKPTLSKDGSSEFQEDWKRVKDEYAKLCQKIEDAAKEMEPCDLTGEYAVFSNIERRNHPSIIKVIWENKEALQDGVPHIIYISREKRPKHPHNFKAGAMNVLTRVSGVMTNAPFMLNVDCDMYANNPQVVLHAMCFLLSGKDDEKNSGYVQFPQHFYDGLKDDPFGNQLAALHEFTGRGIAGIQGPFYQGTGCFHRRKVIYGLSPDDKVTDGNLRNEDLQKAYGKSTEFIKSAANIVSTSNMMMETSDCLSSSIEAACQVAGCGYEYGTRWGKKVGWMYGSATEDILTGLTIQGRGWKTAYCTPNPHAFLGCTPSAGPTSLIQQKRWSTGLLEVLFSSRSPLILTLTRKLQFRQCLAYLWILVWAMRSIFEICYAVLPAYSIISNSGFLPKGDEPAILIPISILAIYNLYTLSEYLRAGLSVRAWWNNQRMWKINSATAWLFGLLSVVLKLFGLSTTAFEVTRKEQTSNEEDDTNDQNIGRFTFDDSPIFIPGTCILLVNLTALAIRLFIMKQTTYGEEISYWGEVICCVLVVLHFWVFLKGLFGKGKFGIPSSTIIKSWALTLLFVHFCKRV